MGRTSANYTHYFHGTGGAANIRTAHDGRSLRWSAGTEADWKSCRPRIWPIVSPPGPRRRFRPGAGVVDCSAVDRPEALVNSDTYLASTGSSTALKPEAQLTVSTPQSCLLP